MLSFDKMFSSLLAKIAHEGPIWSIISIVKNFILFFTICDWGILLKVLVLE